ncbi:MAG: methyltransferase [Oscillospiraceae bacterium]|nr:methyltransferase [Oscillospiraceae bacterium]
MQEILSNGIKVQYPDEHFRLSTDSVVLADFADFRPTDTVCDLGCGCGGLTFLLAAKYPRLHLTGIELQASAAETAKQNAADNALTERVQILCGDLREHRSMFSPCSFDGVIANPPYYPPKSGEAAKSDALAGARSERTCTLDDLCRAAAWLLKTGGRFYLVHKPERLTDLMVCLRAHGLEPKHLRFVRHRPDSTPSLVLLSCRRGGKAGLTLENDLILFETDGSESAEYRRIYHQEG